MVYAESQQSPVLRDRAAARRHRAPSRVGEGTGAFPRGSQKPGQESELSGPPRSKELARNRERKREIIERKSKRKKDTGTKALMEPRCF